jgi:CBS domain-containing protein
MRGDAIVSSSTVQGAPTGAGTVTVGDLMRLPTTTIEPAAHLAAAAFLMKRAGDNALVVTAEGKPRVALGIVTDTAISQAVAEGRDLQQARMTDLLTRPTIDVTPGTRSSRRCG